MARAAPCDIFEVRPQFSPTKSPCFSYETRLLRNRGPSDRNHQMAAVIRQGLRPQGCRALPDFLISFPVMAPVFPCYAAENSLLRVSREFSPKPLLQRGLFRRLRRRSAPILRYSLLFSLLAGI